MCVARVIYQLNNTSCCILNEYWRWLSRSNQPAQYSSNSFSRPRISSECSSFNADDYSCSNFYKASGGHHDSRDVDVLNASTLGNTIFDVNNMLGVLDAEIYNPM